MIGVFDSGVGGLSVLREIRRLLPALDAVYFGDTAHVPYGGRADDEIRMFATSAVQHLLTFRPDAIVVACNTATAVAIHDIRAVFPSLPIIGVVPVVKTLAETTKTKKVAVCATEATLRSAVYAKLKEDFAQGIEFLELPRPEWVLFVEAGEIDSPQAVASVQETLLAIKTFGADTVALGSTHFPFLRPTIEQFAGDLKVLDSGSAVARQVQRVLTANGKLPGSAENGKVTYLVSGDPVQFSMTASNLLEGGIEAQKV